MAKKKGATLSELNEFLKKDPNSLADVNKLSVESVSHPLPENLAVEQIANLIKRLAAREQESETLTLLRVILETLDNKSEESASDILLMNTALYLQHTEKTGEQLDELMK